MPEVDYEARRLTLAQPVPAVFLNLAEPRRVSNSQHEEPTYSARFELEPDSEDLKRIRAKIVAAAREKWPGMDVAAAIKSGELQVTLTAGDVLADKAKAKGKDQEWARGKMCLTARSKMQPSIGYLDDGKIVELKDSAAIKAASKHIYSGALALGIFSFKAYDAVGQSGLPGVKCYFEQYLSTGKGEKKGGGRKSLEESFSGYVGRLTDEDPTGGAADDGGDDW